MSLSSSSMIAGVKLPENKHIVQSLQAIKGIGRSSAVRICEAVKIEQTTKFSEVDEAQREAIRTYIKEHFTVEGELRRFVFEAISRLKSIGCYRGRRHRSNLPVNGQRTKTNAKTARKRRGDK